MHGADVRGYCIVLWKYIAFTNGSMTPSLICEALGNLVLFAQFKKREKHPLRSVAFSIVAGFGLQLY